MLAFIIMYRNNAIAHATTWKILSSPQMLALAVEGGGRSTVGTLAPVLDVTGSNRPTNFSNKGDLYNQSTTITPRS